jgi:UDP-N-acetylmuramate dehydrogenase
VVVLDELRRIVRGPVRLAEPLGPYSALGVGGPADYYVEPAGRAAVIASLRYLTDRGVPVILVRRGANFLVSDDGFRGAALNVETGLGGLAAEGTRVRVEAGVPLARLVDFAVGRSLAGTEILAGESGTVGGALIRELEALASRTEEIGIFDGQRERTVPGGRDAFPAGSPRPLVLSVTLLLDEAPQAGLMRARRDTLLRKNSVVPLNILNGTVAFRDPVGASAAWLIEEAGLKGTRHGGAMVSEGHANIVLNTGRATAEDVVALLRTVQKAVSRKFHRHLELETTLVGFRRELSAA